MKKIAAIILENDKKEILLYLRDNKPVIPFPHHLDLFGGHVEEDETPEEVLRREVKEELGIKLQNYHFFKTYECLEGDVYPNIKYIYVGKINLPISKLTLHEGEKLQFFRWEEIPKLKLANILKKVIMNYTKSETRT